jgi:proteasome lid subunit RPN8/RPN11
MPFEECCGVMLGEGGRVNKLVRLPNIAANKHSGYEMDSVSLVRVLSRYYAVGKLVALYHSHPLGSEAVLSYIDLVQITYPDVMYVVCAPITLWTITIRAYYLQEAQAIEVPVVIS